MVSVVQPPHFASKFDELNQTDFSQIPQPLTPLSISKSIQSTRS